eukprot:scaffold1498_cov163-Amphora_coffeaeformis.AAC.9
MGKLDDSTSIGIGDLPTDDELFLIGENDEFADDLDESERTDQRDNTPKGKRKKKNLSRHQEQRQQESPLADIPGVSTTSYTSTRGRWMVIFVFCAGAAGMAFTTFAYISRTEREEFEHAVRRIDDGILRVFVCVLVNLTTDPFKPLFCLLLSNHDERDNNRLARGRDNSWNRPMKRSIIHFPCYEAQPLRQRHSPRH